MRPVSVMPSVSASDIIVAAVPIVMQVPKLRAMPDSMSRHSSSETMPACLSAQYFQTSLPEPSTLPW